jgi:putative ABC transport system ATP-binding protein
MIRLEGITKVFRSGKVETLALDQVSMEFTSGEFVAVMGPSGCGKSTLLSILGLMDNPDSGRYFLDGREVSGYSERQRTKLRKGTIGFVFQSFNLIDELTVYENVELPLLYMGVGAGSRKSRVVSVLERLGLLDRKNHFPQQLSGGQQQRVAICRALVTDPKIILADEPTGNLDSANGREVMDLLESMKSAGAAVIMVTHSQSDADHADRIVRLFDGKVV